MISATAYFTLEPQGPTSCAQCNGKGRIADSFAQTSSGDASCGMCGGTGSVSAAWNPKKRYRFAGCCILPKDGFQLPYSNSNTPYISEYATCANIEAAMAWVAGWVGQIVERQS